MPSHPPPSADDERLGPGSVLSHLGVMIAISAVLGLLVGGLAIPFAGALGIASKSAAHGLKNLPQELRTQPLAQRSRLLSNGGKTIATFYDVEPHLGQARPDRAGHAHARSSRSRTTASTSTARST